MVYRVMKPDSFDASPELGMGFHFGIHKHSGEGLIVLNAQYAIGSKEIGDGVAFQRLRTSEPKIEEADIVQSDDIALFLKMFGSKLSNATAYQQRANRR